MGCPNNCKVGRCQTCGSDCKRCGCACDGVDPEVALSRARGQRGKAKEHGQQRLAAQRASISIQQQAKDELLNDTPERDKRQKSEPVTSLWDYFGWSPSTKTNLPAIEQRENNPDLKESNRAGWSTMLQCIVRGTRQIASIIYPANPEELCAEAASKLQREDKSMERVVNTIVKMNNGAPKGSIEKRVLRATLIKSLSRAHKNSLVKDGMISLGGGVIKQAIQDYNTLAGGERLVNSRRSLQNFSSEALEDAVAFILHSNNVCALSWGTKELKLDDSEKLIIPNLVRRKTPKQIYEDYVYYQNREQQQQGETNTTSDIILENANVQESENGIREAVQNPASQESTSDTEIPQNLDCLSRGSFYNLLKMLTTKGERLLTAVDYVTGVLVHDQVETLQRIGDEFARDAETRNKLASYLELVRNFYKHYVDQHICKGNDNCCWHGADYGLSSAEGDVREEKCDACMFPYYYFKILKQEVVDSMTGENPRKSQDSGNDALQFIEGAQEKLELYRAHRVRVANQQKEINKLHSDLEAECTKSKKDSEVCVIVIDWKMKFLIMSARR